MEYLNEDLIYGFSASLLHSKFDDPAPFPEVHMDWWRLCCSDHPQVAIAAPRGHAKSTAITHTFVLAAVLFKERDYVMIVSDTQGQAEEFLGDIKRELQENDELIELFGVKKFKRDTQTDIIVEMENGHLFRIVAKGAEQKVRGRKWRGKRPNLIVGDDLENDESVMNDERRAKFNNWLYSALLQAGSSNCLVRIVGTILHMDSALERTMPAHNDPNTVDTGLAQWSKKPKSWLSVRYRAHNEDFSKILWPEMWPKERLLMKRQTFIDQGYPEGYSQEFLNYPIDEENAYYKQEDFVPISDYDVYGEYYIGVDLAISEKDGRAYTVFAVGKLLSSGVLQIVDVVRFRGDSRAIINAFFDLNERYAPEWFALEEENIAKSIGPILEEEMITTGRYIPILKIKPSADKLKRGRPFQARVRTHSVEFDMDAPWFPEYQTEMLHFPRGKYKDQVDATSMLGLGLNRMAEVPTQEDLEEMEYEDEFGDDLLEIALGESITGYGD